MSTVRTKTERRFNPHLLLLRSAQYHLNAARERKNGYYYHWLGAALMSALALEAVGNTYGEFLIPEWKDFESASPIAKLRLVACRCGVKPDFSKEPWLTARLLIRFRNLIAHAKPQHLKQEEDCTLSDYGQVFGAKLESKVEEMVNEPFATKSCTAVEQIVSAFNKALRPSELHALTYDGHESSAQVG